MKFFGVFNNYTFSITIITFIVRSNNDQVIGHIPDGLAEIFYALIEDGKIQRITGKIINEARSALEGTWNKGGGIELP